LGLLRLIALLPYGGLVRLGRGLGAVLRHLPIRFVRTARRNIELCLPELGERAREQLLDAHFASLGIALLEIPLAWWIKPAQLAKIVHFEGVEHLQAARAQGRGVILLTAHFTSLEMAGRSLLSVAPVGFLYRPTKNEVLANQCVWYAPDQSYRKKGAQMVPMFGIPAATNTLTSRLARMTGAAVLPYFFQRLPGTQGYRAVIHPPLENFPSESAVADTERFNHLIEAQVRIAPEQYLWIHRRFKGLSQDYPDYYGPQAPRGA
jgi:KDO2-lipid IV(A) lauroyltransferase